MVSFICTHDVTIIIKRLFLLDCPPLDDGYVVPILKVFSNCLDLDAVSKSLYLLILRPGLVSLFVLNALLSERFVIMGAFIMFLTVYN